MPGKVSILKQHCSIPMVLGPFLKRPGNLYRARKAIPENMVGLLWTAALLTIFRYRRRQNNRLVSDIDYVLIEDTKGFVLPNKFQDVSETGPRWLRFFTWPCQSRQLSSVYVQNWKASRNFSWRVKNVIHVQGPIGQDLFSSRISMDMTGLSYVHYISWNYRVLMRPNRRFFWVVFAFFCVQPNLYE